MAPPLHAWRRTPINRNFRASSAAARRANRGFTRPVRSSKVGNAYGTLKSKMGTKGLLAAGILPAVAGLGALIGGLVPSKKKKTQQEGSGAWGGSSPTLSARLGEWGWHDVAKRDSPS